jgi:hypothetical protein
MKKWYMNWMAGDVAVIPIVLLALGLVVGIIGIVIFNHSDQLNNSGRASTPTRHSSAPPPPTRLRAAPGCQSSALCRQLWAE